MFQLVLFSKIDVLSTFISPCLGFNKPKIKSIKVLLPEPVDPIIPIVFPEFISSIIAIQIVSLTVIPGTITLLYESKFLALEKSKFIPWKLIELIENLFFMPRYMMRR